jgi:uncharacterized membrane protein
MTQFLAGLALFFGMHSMSIAALPARDRLAARIGIGWKISYGAVSLLGLVLVSRGYAELRPTTALLYDPPIWLRHVAAILLLPAFVLFLAPYFPGRIKTAVRHPQLFAVMLWAVAHLLVNGTLADLALFGCFLAWAVADLASMKHRAARPVPSVPESAVNDLVAVVAGLAVYGAFAFWLHEKLIGVRPFG